LLTVNVSTPVDTGGAPITGYLVYFVDANETEKVCGWICSTSNTI
jgi:hypothetical protein